MNISSLKIAELLNSSLVGESTKIQKIMLSSKDKADNNGCFVAIKGEKHDGNDFIDEAIKNGARLLITTRVPKIKIPYILVDDTILALGRLGNYNKGKTRIIGVTGSVGKTTTKDMISAILSQKYNIIATKENENNEIGVAKTLLSIKNHDFCIVEMGMRALGEIRYLSKMCEPDISVITNCGSAHLEILKTRENIFKAKAEIIEYTKHFAVIPNEPYFKNFNFVKVKPIFIGASGNYEIEKCKVNEKGIIIKFKDNNLNKISQSFYLNAVGRYNAQNALNAYAVAKLIGVDENDIKKGILGFKSSKMRGNIKLISNLTIIEDCYNSSYEGMIGAIDALVDFSLTHNKTPYLLVGDMLEIGEGADEYHYRIGEYAKDKCIRNVFSYGSKSKHILDGFCGGIDFKNEDAIAFYIKQNLGKDDVLLIKASREMHFERIISKIEGVK